MPGQHARLSPSAASRWIACPASVRLSAEVPDGDESPYAREGTLAHARAEIEAGAALGLITARAGNLRRSKWLYEAGAELDDEAVNEISAHAVAYAAELVERAGRRPGSSVVLEKRVKTGIEGAWGTADAIVFSPTHVEVIDFKYGAGVQVDAENNPQLMLYGLGGLGYVELLGDVEDVFLTVIQPRAGGTSTWELTAAELEEWRHNVAQPAAREALSATARFNPGERQCRWCPAAGICRPRMEAATAEDFSSDPDVLDNAELGELLARIPAIREWANAVDAAVLRKLYSEGQEIPGWKVVRSGGRRSITDEQQAISLLIDAGFTGEQVSVRKTKTLGVLEKLIGASELSALLDGILIKGEGKPAVAREGDPRAAINPGSDAVSDFTKTDLQELI